MAFEWNKLKQGVPGGKVGASGMDSSDIPMQPLDVLPVKKTAAKKQPAFMRAISDRLTDVKNVLEEGKYSLFIKQIVVLLLVVLLVKGATSKLSEHKAKLKDQMAAIKIQQANRDDYLANKQQLLRLEPMFPDIAKKGDWLIRSLIDLFEEHGIKYTMDGNPTEDSSNPVYTTASLSVFIQSKFNDLGNFLADVENGNDLLRVSDFSIMKLGEGEELGENRITLKFNTVFPKEKYAPKLFKDYKQQMANIKKEKAARGGKK